MLRISQERRDGRRLQILEAAWRWFYEKGLRGTATHDLIRDSDLSADAVYLYFPNMQTIILAAIRTSLAGARTLTDEILEKGEYDSLSHLLEKLAAATDRIGKREEYDLRSNALLGLSGAQTNVAVRDAMVPTYLDFLSKLRAAIKRGQKCGIVDRNVSADAAATVLLSLLLGNVVQAALLKNNPLAKYLRESWSWRRASIAFMESLHSSSRSMSAIACYGR